MKVRIKKLPKKAYGGQQPAGALNVTPAAWGDVTSRKAKSGMEVKQSLTKIPRSMANLEAEGGETAFGPISGDTIPDHFKIKGPRHTNGGVPLNLPDDTFIFSDTKAMKITDPNVLKMFGKKPKKGGHTPADLAKPYDINKYKQILLDPETDRVQRETAELMIKNYVMKLGALALAQESKKGFPQGVPEMARPYMDANGITDEDLMPEEQMAQQGGMMRNGGISKFYGGGNVNIKQLNRITIDGSLGEGTARILKDGKPITGKSGIVRVKGVRAVGDKIIVLSNMGDQPMGEFVKEGDSYTFVPNDFIMNKFNDGATEDDKLIFESFVNGIETNNNFRTDVQGAVMGKTKYEPRTKSREYFDPEYKPTQPTVTTTTTGTDTKPTDLIMYEDEVPKDIVVTDEAGNEVPRMSKEEIDKDPEIQKQKDLQAQELDKYNKYLEDRAKALADEEYQRYKAGEKAIRVYPDPDDPVYQQMLQRQRKGLGLDQNPTNQGPQAGDEIREDGSVWRNGEMINDGTGSIYETFPSGSSSYPGMNTGMMYDRYGMPYDAISRQQFGNYYAPRPFYNRNNAGRFGLDFSNPFSNRAFRRAGSWLSPMGPATITGPGFGTGVPISGFPMGMTPTSIDTEYRKNPLLKALFNKDIARKEFITRYNFGPSELSKFTDAAEIEDAEMLDEMTNREFARKQISGKDRWARRSRRDLERQLNSGEITQEEYLDLIEGDKEEEKVVENNTSSNPADLNEDKVNVVNDAEKIDLKETDKVDDQSKTTQTNKPGNFEVQEGETISEYYNRTGREVPEKLETQVDKVWTFNPDGTGDWVEKDEYKSKESIKEKAVIDTDDPNIETKEVLESDATDEDNVTQKSGIPINRTMMDNFDPKVETPEYIRRYNPGLGDPRYYEKAFGGENEILNMFVYGGYYPHGGEFHSPVEANASANTGVSNDPFYQLEEDVATGKVKPKDPFSELEQRVTSGQDAFQPSTAGSTPPNVYTPALGNPMGNTLTLGAGNTNPDPNPTGVTSKFGTAPNFAQLNKEMQDEIMLGNYGKGMRSPSEDESQMDFGIEKMETLPAVELENKGPKELVGDKKGMFSIKTKQKIKNAFDFSPEDFRQQAAFLTNLGTRAGEEIKGAKRLKSIQDLDREGIQDSYVTQGVRRGDEFANTQGKKAVTDAYSPADIMSTMGTTIGEYGGSMPFRNMENGGYPEFRNIYAGPLTLADQTSLDQMYITTADPEIPFARPTRPWYRSFLDDEEIQEREAFKRKAFENYARSGSGDVNFYAQKGDPSVGYRGYSDDMMREAMKYATIDLDSKRGKRLQERDRQDILEYKDFFKNGGVPMAAYGASMGGSYYPTMSHGGARRVRITMPIFENGGDGDKKNNQGYYNLTDAEKEAAEKGFELKYRDEDTRFKNLGKGVGFQTGKGNWKVDPTTGLYYNPDKGQVNPGMKGLESIGQDWSGAATNIFEGYKSTTDPSIQGFEGWKADYLAGPKGKASDATRWYVENVNKAYTDRGLKAPIDVTKKAYDVFGTELYNVPALREKQLTLDTKKPEIIETDIKRDIITRDTPEVEPVEKINTETGMKDCHCYPLNAQGQPDTSKKPISTTQVKADQDCPDCSATVVSQRKQMLMDDPYELPRYSRQDGRNLLTTARMSTSTPFISPQLITSREASPTLYNPYTADITSQLTNIGAGIDAGGGTTAQKFARRMAAMSKGLGQTGNRYFQSQKDNTGIVNRFALQNIASRNRTDLANQSAINTARLKNLGQLDTKMMRENARLKGMNLAENIANQRLRQKMMYNYFNPNNQIGYADDSPWFRRTYRNPNLTKPEKTIRQQFEEDKRDYGEAAALAMMKQGQKGTVKTAKPAKGIYGKYGGSIDSNGFIPRYTTMPFDK